MPTLRSSAATAVIALAALLVLPSCGSYRLVSSGGMQFDKTGEKRTKEDAGPLPASLERLDIDHRFGVVTVRAASDSETPGFAWKLSCWGRTVEDAERFLGEIELVRAGEGDRLGLALHIPENPGTTLRGVESRLEIRIPASAELGVRNAHGEVEVSGLEGAVDGECEHCAVRLSDLDGAVTFRTSFDDLRAHRIGGGDLANQHGAVDVEAVAADLVVKTSFAPARIVDVLGTVTAENSHGDLTIERTRGEVRAATSFAGLSVSEIGGSAHLRNSHGGIVTRAVRGTVDAETSFAPIDLECAGESAVAMNSHGEITLALTGETVRSVRAETSYADLSLRIPPGARPAVIIDQKHGEVECPIPATLAQTASAIDDAAPRVELKVRHGDIVVTEGSR